MTGKKPGYFKTSRKYKEFLNYAVMLLNDQDMEISVLGSLLLGADINELNLGVEDFFTKAHQRIFDVMLTLHERGVKIEIISVVHELQTRYPDELAEMGGATYLNGILNTVPTSTHAVHYAEGVKDLSDRRRIVSCADRMVAAASEQETSISDVIDKTLNIIKDIPFSGRRSRNVDFKNVRIITSSPPVYLITVCAKDKELDMRFNSADLDKRANFKRKIREAFDFNPVLEPQIMWDIFINRLLEGAVKKEAPAATATDSDTLYWLKEWYKKMSPAEDVTDLQRGYVMKNDMVCIAAQPVVRWLRDTAKHNITPQDLWVV